MAAPRLDDVIVSIRNALADDHGGGLDLSGPGRVLRGRYTSPPAAALPCAAISGTTNRTQRGAVMTRWTTTCALAIDVWAASPELSAESRVVCAESVCDAVTFALQTAADTTGNTLHGLPDLLITTDVVSDLDEGDGHAHVRATVGWTLHRATRGLSR
jgi:hypothetical protein